MAVVWPMNLAWNPTKVLITGRSGSGKSVFWTKYLLGSDARWKFVFDHDGQLSHRLGARPARTLDDLSAYAARGFCLFEPSLIFPGRLPEAFEFFCRFVFEAGQGVRGRKLFACDELQKFCPSRQLPEAFAAILQTGRVYEIDAAFISVAPNRIHPDIRNQASEVVAFNSVGTGAVELLENEWGFCGADLRALGKFEFIARRDTGGEVRGRVSV